MVEIDRTWNPTVEILQIRYGKCLLNSERSAEFIDVTMMFWTQINLQSIESSKYYSNLLMFLLDIGTNKV